MTYTITYCNAFRVIFLTEENAEKLQVQLERVPVDILTPSTSLIFYEDGIGKRRIHQAFQNFSKIKINSSPSKIADVINLFIQLHKSLGEMNTGSVVAS